MVGGSKNHSVNHDDGTFLTRAFHDAFIFGFVERRSVRFHCCIGNLHQYRFDVDTGTCNPK